MQRLGLKTSGYALLALFALVATGCDFWHDNDQSTAMTDTIRRHYQDLRRTGGASVTFAYQPTSTTRSGTIGEYTVTIEVTGTGTSERKQLTISEKGKQTHATYAVPDIVVPRRRISVNKGPAEPVTIVLTRVGEAIHLTEMR